jgi:hypothetical protein
MSMLRSWLGHDPDAISASVKRASIHHQEVVDKAVSASIENIRKAEEITTGPLSYDIKDALRATLDRMEKKDASRAPNYPQ